MTAFTQGAPLVQAAYEFAARAHADQTQDSDATPYIDHAVGVGRMLSEAHCEEHVVAAGLLHDVVEKSDVSLERIRARFGPRVADLVQAMTEPADVDDYEARKAALREQVIGAGPDAEAIFAADKAYNVASLRRAIAAQG